MAYRARASSPPPRVYLETPRASTGAVPTSSYDTHFGQPQRSSFSYATIPRGSISVGRNSVYETQPVSKKTYASQNQPGATISRTEYAVRPRRESQASDTRRPLSVVTKNTSPSRDYPSASDTPRESIVAKVVPRDDSSRFLQPARASNQYHHHQRHNSATRAELDQYNVGRYRERRPKEYHRGGPFVEEIRSGSRPVVEDGYTYTGPREQFARDLSSRAPRRDSLTRRERPSSAIDPEFKALPWVRRDNGPPPAAARQLERLDVPEKYSRSGFDSDPDRPSEVPRRRHSTKPPILHQHRDEGYSSARDDYGSRRSSKTRDSVHEDDYGISKGRQKEQSRDVDRERDRLPAKEYDRQRLPDRERVRERIPDRDREGDLYAERDRPRDHDRADRDVGSRRQPRSRETSPDHSAIKGIAAATGLGGLATAVIANRKGRKDEDDSSSENRKEKKHRRHRSRDHREEDLIAAEGDEHKSRRRHHERHRAHAPDGSSSDTPEDQSSHRRRSSKSRRKRDVIDDESEGLRSPIPIVEPEERGRELVEPEVQHDRNLQREENGSPSTLEGRTLSPGEGEDERPRRVMLVEPVRDKTDNRPKGILKPPRAVPFPEDPNPTREGVAPLKAAGKGGIPEGARWTKINRLLVNPEALEQSHERFEEREDYVVVLRVLTKEEIEKFAEKTKQIRENRERIWQQQLEERRKRKATEREHENGDILPEEEGDEHTDKPPLAIEPAAAPPVDLRNLQGQDAIETERTLTGAAPVSIPVPEITVDHSNYSENV